MTTRKNRRTGTDHGGAFPGAARLRARWPLPTLAQLAYVLAFFAVVGWVDQALRGAL